MTKLPNDLLSAFRILPGADVHFSEQILRQLDQGKATTVNDGGKFLFVEFPSYGIPYRAEEVLFQLRARGIIPVISHPERNMEIAKRPQRYYEMIRTGCLGQVTAMSLTGGFGSEIRRVAEKLLNHRLLHFIASDAHSANGRPPVLSDAVREAAKIVGKEQARKMVTEYPQAILEGRRPTLPEPSLKD
jgi:protein-tyrosine phosphatase